MVINIVDFSLTHFVLALCFVDGDVFIPGVKYYFYYSLYSCGFTFRPRATWLNDSDRDRDKRTDLACHDYDD